MQIPLLRPILHSMFFVSAFVLSLMVHGEPLNFVGEAVSIETGEHVYTERHQVQRTNSGQFLTSRVDYISAEGGVLAEKTLNFSQNVIAPKLRFSDKQNGLTYVSRMVDDELELVVEPQAVSDSAGSTIALSIEDEQTIVVDAGFDQYLNMEWDRLLAGEVLGFEFLALSRGKLVRFELSLVSLSDTRAKFSIRPSSWLVNLLMDPIYLEYALDSRRLLRYQGLSNIPNPNEDENYRVVIDYVYGDDALVSLDRMTTHLERSL